MFFCQFDLAVTLSGTPVKHDTSLWQLSYQFLYRSVVTGAQSEVPHCYIFVFFHSFQRWERGVIRGIPRGIYPHQAENAAKTIEVRVEIVPEKEGVSRSHFYYFPAPHISLKSVKVKQITFLYQFDLEVTLI